MVALANAFTGSDGEKFSHSFQLIKLGPLIGTRTWGGVTGIIRYRALVDGTLTSQPECPNRFSDIDTLENRGAIPDIEVEMAPQETQELQLDRAIDECLNMIERFSSVEGEMERF